MTHNVYRAIYVYTSVRIATALAGTVGAPKKAFGRVVACPPIEESFVGKGTFSYLLSPPYKAACVGNEEPTGTEDRERDTALKK